MYLTQLLFHPVVGIKPGSDLHQHTFLQRKGAYEQHTYHAQIRNKPENSKIGKQMVTDVTGSSVWLWPGALV